MYARDTWTRHATSPDNISRYVNCSFINVALSYFVANVYANKRSCAFVLYDKFAIRRMETDMTIYHGLIALQVVIFFFSLIRRWYLLCRFFKRQNSLRQNFLSSTIDTLAWISYTTILVFEWKFCFFFNHRGRLNKKISVLIDYRIDINYKRRNPDGKLICTCSI